MSDSLVTCPECAQRVADIIFDLSFICGSHADPSDCELSTLDCEYFLRHFPDYVRAPFTIVVSRGASSDSDREVMESAVRFGIASGTPGAYRTGGMLHSSREH